MTKRRISTSRDLVWTTGDKTLLQTLPIAITTVSAHKIRTDAKVFHEPIIRRLVHEQRLRRNDLPAGRKYLDRLLVNYIRHNLVNTERHRDERYSGILEAARQSSDFLTAYIALNTRILDAIIEMYLYLKDACEVQKHDSAYYIDPEDIFTAYEQDCTDASYTT